MRQVVTGERVYMGHVETHLHQLQLVIWQIVAQNCAIFDGLNIFHMYSIVKVLTIMLKWMKIILFGMNPTLGSGFLDG